MSPRLDVRRLDKFYGRRNVFSQWSRSFPVGFHGITGPNGVGKSTLLSVLARAEPYQAGEILFEGEVLRDPALEYHQSMGYCPDRLIFYPFVTVTEFFRLAATARQCAVPDGSHPLVAGFNVQRELETRLDALSLGTQKKVLLITAMMNRAKVLLLDEPTDELDVASRQFLIDELHQWRDTACIISTHDFALLDALDAVRNDLGHG